MMPPRKKITEAAAQETRFTGFVTATDSIMVRLKQTVQSTVISVVYPPEKKPP
jgi:hypothetical protein